MKNKCKILLSLLIIMQVYSEPVIIWNKIYGAKRSQTAESIDFTNDGHLILTGKYNSPIESGIPAMKINYSGDTLWTKIHSKNQSLWAYSIDALEEGGFIITGLSNFAKETQDLYLLRLDDNGNFLWDKSYGGAYLDAGYCVKEYKEGFVIAGETVSYPQGVHYGWLLRTNNVGDTIWTKLFEKAEGASAFNLLSSLEVVDNEYIIAAGSSNHQYYIAKIDSNGSIIWEKRWGYFAEYLRSISKTTDNGFILGGWNFDIDGYILKLDENGDSVWAVSYGDTSRGEIMAVKQTIDGNYIAAGYFAYSAWILKINSIGEFLWEVKVGSDAYNKYYDILETSKGNYIAVGYTESMTEFPSDILITNINENTTSISINHSMQFRKEHKRLEKFRNKIFVIKENQKYEINGK